jgi:hypothetical protein
MEATTSASPHETVIASYSEGRHTVDRFVGNRFTYLGGPRGVHSSLGNLTGSSGASVPAALADTAELVLRYLNEAGDLASAKPQSIEVDRRIIELMAASYFHSGGREFNDSAVAREVGLSHTSVRDRRLARSARIMAALHRDAPDLWDAKGFPVHQFVLTASAA